MNRRDFLGALGFTIIVPQFGPMFKQGQGARAHTPLGRTIILASGRDFDQALAVYARRLGEHFSLNSALANFVQTNQRGVYKLEGTPKGFRRGSNGLFLRSDA